VLKYYYMLIKASRGQTSQKISDLIIINNVLESEFE